MVKAGPSVYAVVLSVVQIIVESTAGDATTSVQSVLVAGFDETTGRKATSAEVGVAVGEALVGVGAGSLEEQPTKATAGKTNSTARFRHFATVVID